MDSGKQTVSISFNELPKNLAQLQALPESSLDTPFKTAALTVCALCAYPSDKDAAIEMLNFLKGPQPLSPYDIQFLRDRFMDGKTYVPVSYFKGAVPGKITFPPSPSP